MVRNEITVMPFYISLAAFDVVGDRTRVAFQFQRCRRKCPCGHFQSPSQAERPLYKTYHRREFLWDWQVA